MRTTFKAGALALGLAASAFAESSGTDLKAEIEALKTQVKQQSQEINQLRSANGESWLTQRRADEIKTLVREVLADADTRASLQEGGLTAGWKDHFFLGSEDGNYLLVLSGQEQIRYIFNERNEDEREHNNGFQNRRTMLSFAGHLFDPKFTYEVSLLVATGDELNDSVNSHVTLQNAWFAYEFADGWQVKGGQFKAPFLREELVHSSKQQAVERSLVADLTTVDYTQGLQVSYLCPNDTLPARVAAMIHDGSYAANSNFPSTLSTEAEIGIAGRGELLLSGDWKQFEDFATWSGDSTGILVGAAIDWEEAENEDGSTPGDLLKWTVDGSIELPELMGLNLFGAVIGAHVDTNGDLGVIDSDNYFYVAQAGFFLIPDKLDLFFRFEYADLDDDFGVEDIDMYTFGGNYYLQGHKAKLSLDVVWVAEPLPSSALLGGDFFYSGAGLMTSSEENQIAIRGQFQFLF